MFDKFSFAPLRMQLENVANLYIFQDTFKHIYKITFSFDAAK